MQSNPNIAAHEIWLRLVNGLKDILGWKDEWPQLTAKDQAHIISLPCEPFGSCELKKTKTKQTKNIEIHRIQSTFLSNSKFFLQWLSVNMGGQKVSYSSYDLLVN